MSAPAGLIDAQRALKTWLLRDAYPLWAAAGPDQDLGGWHDRLDMTGAPVPGPQRARVQARQAWTFAQAPALGWDGDWREAMLWGLGALQFRFRRTDGLYRGTVAAQGRPSEDAELYDQAFVLLALSAAHTAGEPGAEAAAELLLSKLAPHPAAGFRELSGETLLANPNMHLFEAFLAWTQAGGGSVWRALADRQAQLAHTRLIDLESGALFEDFGTDWTLPGDPALRRVEPGHQFEWAWLLLKWCQIAGRPQDLRTALNLIALSEASGVDAARGVAINELDGELALRDAAARLWPQTERLKANALAGAITGDPGCWVAAEAAARSLLSYLNVPRPGLWWDRMRADGGFVEEAAPASSFYHIVLAIQALDEAIGMVA